MFQKVLEYAGEYRKVTCRAAAVMLIGTVMSILPFLFIYQLIAPLLLHQSMTAAYICWRVAAIAVCGLLYAVLYVRGLALSHEAAYHTLKNLRISLQGKLEKQPLGTIQEKGVGTLKKTFIDDIESIELLLAHALPRRRCQPSPCRSSSSSPCFWPTGSWPCCPSAPCLWAPPP